jgi:hypothetical protein
MPGMSGMYLSMNPGGGYAVTTSPAFDVNVDVAGTAAAGAAMAGECACLSLRM